MTTATESIEIQVDSRQVLDERLDDAVRGLQQLAMETGTQGILLTRHKARPLHGGVVRPGPLRHDPGNYSLNREEPRCLTQVPAVGRNKPGPGRRSIRLPPGTFFAPSIIS